VNALTDEQVIDIMRSRVRTYMLTVIAIIFGGFIGGGGLMALLAPALDKSTAKAVLPTLGVLLMLGVVGGSWVAVFRLLRCPRCDRLVVYEFSWNYSLFAGMAQGTCNGCGAQLFAPAAKKRVARMLIVVVVVAMLFSFAGAFMSMNARKHRAPHGSAQPASQP
jgi:hypothetical protein